MIRHFYRTESDTPIQALSEPRDGVWTHVVEPTEAELQSLIAQYGFDDVIIDDSRDVFEVPRFEQDGTVSYFFARYPYDVKDIDIETAPILIILGQTFLITIANQDVPFLEPFMAGKREFSTVQRTKLFLEIMSELVVTYEKKLTRMRKVVYRDMGRVRDIRSRDIQRLVFLEQELNETMSALVPTHEWLQQLTKGNYIQMFSEDREMLEDLLIANTQLIDSAKSILKTIQNIRSASEAILTQNLNATIRRLTAFTIVLTIPTLVSSLFGMNIPLPLQENPHAFLYVAGIVIVAVSGTIYFFKTNRWI
jgi:magnesium transporter